jgi:hypothetical protein
MIGVTLFGIFLTPVFFYVIRRVAGQRTPPSVPAKDRSDVRKDLSAFRNREDRFTCSSVA